MAVGRVSVAAPLGVNTPGTAAAVALRLANKAGLGKHAKRPETGFSDAERRAQDAGVAELFGLKKDSRSSRPKADSPGKARMVKTRANMPKADSPGKARMVKTRVDKAGLIRAIKTRANMPKAVGARQRGRK